MLPSVAWDQAPKWGIGPKVGKRAKAEKKIGEQSRAGGAFGLLRSPHCLTEPSVVKYLFIYLFIYCNVYFN